ncbi:Scr1 family TA system antitoxin-like transcriptional regulator [Streptomyces sp. NPDC005799]|uniref:Scr1 family TA system antitoxin-like transcriptional regulator n=1 Tax=Streptomyces sp. NPDC005799 TaxID=3154678 RepID=UPI0033D08489
MLHTPQYARHVFGHYAELQLSPRDVEDAVRARIARQALLYEPGRIFRILLWEAAPVL